MKYINFLRCGWRRGAALPLMLILTLSSISGSVFAQIPVILDFPSAGLYNLQIVISADGKATIKNLQTIKVPANGTVIVPPKPDDPIPPVVPKTDLYKVLELPEFSNLRPFFPAIGDIYEIKSPEEVRQAIQDVLATAGDPARIATLKDDWAVLGGRIADYYDKLVPQPELEEFMKVVAKELKSFK